MIKVVIHQGDLRRILRGLTSVQDEIHNQAREVPKKAANKFALELINAIASQKYSALHPALSPSYRKWKEKRGYPLKTWIMTGTLVHSIQARPLYTNLISGSRKTFAYFSGIPNKTLHPGGGGWSGEQGPKDLAWIARMSEYGRPASGGTGGGPQPKRPILQPEFKDFADKQFPEFRNGAMGPIARRWV